MFALKNLLRRRTRSILTILGVGVGVATVVALVAVSRGFRSQFDTIFAAGETHLVLTLKNATDPFISYLPEELSGQVAERDRVASTHPFVWGLQQVPEQPFFIIFGVTSGSPFLTETRVIEGEPLFEAEGELPSMLLGSLIAEELGVEVGDEFELGSFVFRIVGLFEASVPLYEGGGLIDFPLAQDILNLEGKASTIFVQLNDPSPESILAGGAALEEAFPEVRASEPARLTDSFDQFDLTAQGVVVFTVLAILVGGIGVMNTMLMSVFERTREIGVLQAIGWSKGRILRQILAEGVLVCLAGGVVGVTIGVAGVEAIANFTDLVWVAGDYGPEIFLQALVVAICMGAVGSAYPAYRAVQITPIAALRYE
ncbi:MAG: FtsX-like permease family protein [Planctomycetota bacterium]